TDTTAVDRLAQIPAEDPAVYEALGRADTVGVFQIESRAQMSMLPRLKPKAFYDLVVEVAIVRPGPIQGGMVHPYLKRRMGQELPESPHPCLDPILHRTLGIPLFQEQVMQIAITGAGYTGGEADQLRRDMAAWRRTGSLERHRDRLKEGFLKSGISSEWADRLFAQIQGFAEYGFPESHASSFALLVYASSWLKVHHPAAFVTALVNSLPMGFYSASTLFEDAKRHAVELTPIDVNESGWDCSLPNASDGPDGTVRGPVRIGLALVKGLGEEQGRRIETERRERGPFQTLEDFVARTGVAKDQLEHLAEAGALESITTTRRAALYRARAPRDGELFASHVIDPTEPVFAPLRATEQLVLDYARTGVSLGQHPMAIVRPRLPARIKRSDALKKGRDGTRVEVAGMVICRQRPATASGVVFFTLEDESGFVNLVVWSDTYERLKSVLNGSKLLRVRGKLQIDPESRAVVHVVVESAEPLPLELTGTVDIPTMSRDFH
ncbi:MAG: error-prone DNA polymerase, partial [Proteobacteria bacterium]